MKPIIDYLILAFLFIGLSGLNAYYGEWETASAWFVAFVFYTLWHASLYLVSTTQKKEINNNTTTSNQPSYLP